MKAPEHVKKRKDKLPTLDATTPLGLRRTKEEGITTWSPGVSTLWQELERWEKELPGIKRYWPTWKNAATFRDVAQGRKKREISCLLPSSQYPIRFPLA